MSYECTFSAMVAIFTCTVAIVKCSCYESFEHSVKVVENSV